MTFVWSEYIYGRGVLNFVNQYIRHLYQSRTHNKNEKEKKNSFYEEKQLRIFEIDMMGLVFDGFEKIILFALATHKTFDPDLGSMIFVYLCTRRTLIDSRFSNYIKRLNKMFNV